MEENLNVEKGSELDVSVAADLRANIVVRENESSPSGLETIVGCGCHSEAAAQAYDYNVTAFRHQYRREVAVGDANPAITNRAFSDGLKI